MANRARAAALSAAGLMLIAGCSGGHSAGSLPAAGPNLGQTSQLTNGAAVTLSITVPPKSTQSNRRAAASQQYSKRKPSYVSPSTYYVALNVFYGGASIYSTYFPLSQCTSSYGIYTCDTNLPYGTVTVYTNLYDQSGYLLSTNFYANPAATTIYPNGSSQPNNIYVTTQGVLSNIQEETAVDCFAAGYQQSIPLLFLDADGNQIVGPLANPITANVVAYNGAGKGAIDIYASYGGSSFSADGITLYDTALYSPYIYVSGLEGAVTVGGTVQNIPVYSNNTLTYTPSQQGYAATGTYVAWGIQNGPLYGLYPIAVEQSLNQAVVCQSANGTQNSWTYIGSILDPVTSNPYLVVSDFSNDVYIFDALVTANYTHAYSFFQSGSSYGRPGPQYGLLQTGVFTSTGPFVDFLTSANVTGRIDVLSEPGPDGQINLVNTSSGAITTNYAFSAQIPLTGSTRLSGSTAVNVLYYSYPGTTLIYGVNTSTDVNLATFDMATQPGSTISGQVYAMSPSGNGSNTVLVRGADTGGSYHICAFDASNFGLGMYCANTGSMNSNPSSMTYDSLTGSLMWATGSTSAYAFSVHNVAPSTFVTNFSTAPAIYTTLAHSANRLLGMEGTPGVAGLYGSTGTGPCAGTSEITWLRWNGDTWQYLSTLCWPNHDVTLTYP